MDVGQGETLVGADERHGGRFFVLLIGFSFFLLECQPVAHENGRLEFPRGRTTPASEPVEFQNEGTFPKSPDEGEGVEVPLIRSASSLPPQVLPTLADLIWPVVNAEPVEESRAGGSPVRAFLIALDLGKQLVQSLVTLLGFLRIVRRFRFQQRL